MVQENLRVRQIPPPPAPAATPDEKLSYLIELQTATVQQLQQIADTLAGKPIITPPTIIQPIIPLPLDMELLNTLIQATRYEGKIWIAHMRLTWACPAGAVTEFPLNMPVGLVCTRRRGTIISDFYDEDIMVNVYVDRKPISFAGLPLTGILDFDFGEGYVKREVVQIDCDNGTATDAQLTFDMGCSLMEKSFFESFYQPLFELVYESIQKISEGVSHGQV